MELTKATTIEEAYQVFETNVPLNQEQNREFYVDIYHKDLLNLRKDLKLNRIPDKSFFVTGQSGNGKSTALNFLPDETINLNEGQVGADISLRAKLPFWSLINFDSGFFAKFKIEKSSRETIREIFTLDKLELVEKVNDMIRAYKSQENTGKKLLIIIDDLEKIRDHGQTRELFIDNIDVFQKIEIDAARAIRLRSMGYKILTQTIPDSITPKNRLLMGEYVIP